MKKHLHSLIFGCLLVLGLLPAAQAANYVFPGTLPAGCSGAGPNYTCGALNLGNNDTITINTPRPATITFSGNFDTNNAKINQGGLAISLNLIVNGVEQPASVHKKLSAKYVQPKYTAIVYNFAYPTDNKECIK